MPKIVNVQLRRGRPERFLVTIEDEQEFLFTPETVLQFAVAPDKEFTAEEFLEMLDKNALQLAKDQALRYLTMRPHSRVELSRKLREKGYTGKIIEAAIRNLEKVGLINDLEFTRLYIQNETALKPVSRNMLRHKLLEKGISRQMVEQELAALFSPELERDILLKLADKFIRTRSRLKGKKLKEKLIRHLQRLGFSWDQIGEVLDRNDFSDDQ